MSNKLKIIIICIVLVLLVLLIINKVKKSREKVNIDNKNNITTNYNKEDGNYRVVDENTGEIIYEGTSEEDAYLYQIDPTYKSSNPDIIDEYEMVEVE